MLSGNHCGPQPSGGFFPQQLRGYLRAAAQNIAYTFCGFGTSSCQAGRKSSIGHLTLCTPQSLRSELLFSASPPRVRLNSCRPISSGEFTKHGIPEALVAGRRRRRGENPLPGK